MKMDVPASDILRELHGPLIQDLLVGDSAYIEFSSLCKTESNELHVSGQFAVSKKTTSQYRGNLVITKEPGGAFSSVFETENEKMPDISKSKILIEETSNVLTCEGRNVLFYNDPNMKTFPLLNIDKFKNLSQIFNEYIALK